MISRAICGADALQIDNDKEFIGRVLLISMTGQLSGVLQKLAY